MIGGMAWEHNFPLESGLANTGKYYFASKITVIVFCNKMAPCELYSDFLGPSHGGLAPHREVKSLNGRPGLPQRDWASQREARPYTGRPDGYQKSGFSKRGQPSHMEAGPFIGWLGQLQGGQAPHRQVGPITGRPGLSQGGSLKHSSFLNQSLFYSNMNMLF